MTEHLAKLEREGNAKRIGAVYGPGQTGPLLSISLDGWEPAVGDMFYVDGLHGSNPVTGEDTGQDRGLVVSRVTESNGRTAVLEMGYPIIISGMYRNSVEPPADGAALYQPAGELLKRIWEAWLATSV